MLLFLILLILALAGVGVYAHYNTGAHDVVLRQYHFAAVPDWLPVAVAAGVIALLMILYMIYASIRIGMLRRSNRRLRSDRDAAAEAASRPLPEDRGLHREEAVRRDDDDEAARDRVGDRDRDRAAWDRDRDRGQRPLRPSD
jgi:hypothetical protein